MFYLSYLRGSQYGIRSQRYLMALNGSWKIWTADMGAEGNDSISSQLNEGRKEGRKGGEKRLTSPKNLRTVPTQASPAG
jgi:hypothetical protein